MKLKCNEHSRKNKKSIDWNGLIGGEKKQWRYNHEDKWIKVEGNCGMGRSKKKWIIRDGMKTYGVDKDMVKDRGVVSNQ